MHIGQNCIHARRHDPERAPRQHCPFVIQPAHQHFQSVARLTEDVGGRDLAILEHEFTSIGSAHPQLVELLSCRESGHAFFDQESSDAMRAGIRISLGIDDQSGGIRAIRDPHLITIKNVASIGLRTLLLRAQTHRKHV